MGHSTSIKNWFIHCHLCGSYRLTLWLQFSKWQKSKYENNRTFIWQEELHPHYPCLVGCWNIADIWCHSTTLLYYIYPSLNNAHYSTLSYYFLPPVLVNYSEWLMIGQTMAHVTQVHFKFHNQMVVTVRPQLPKQVLEHEEWNSNVLCNYLPQ